MELTLATRSDLPAILELKKSMHQSFCDNIPDIYEMSEVLYTSDFIEGCFSYPHKKIMLVKQGAQILSYAIIEYINVALPMMKNRTYSYVHEIVVNPNHKGQGIGQILMKYIEEDAKVQEMTHIELAVHEFNERAISFFINGGFVTRTMRWKKSWVKISDCIS